nr:MAG TPA: hypothetical protein [Caudoviricetes sp.]
MQVFFRGKEKLVFNYLFVIQRIRILSFEFLLVSYF